MSRISEAIQKVPLRKEVADCEEWFDAAGGTLYVRELTGSERLANERFQMQRGVDGKGEVDKKALAGAFAEVRKRVVVQALIDENGEHVFSDESELDGVSGEIVARLSDQIMAMNGMAGDAIETAAGNSGTSQDDASG